MPSHCLAAAVVETKVLFLIEAKLPKTIFLLWVGR